MSGSTSNFLFQGAPIPSQPTGSDTATSFPLWLQQYTANLAGAASNVASQQYQPYTGPQVAQPSADTQNAWNLTNQNLGNYQPALAQANALTAQAGQPIQTPGAIQSPTPISAGTINTPGAITAPTIQAPNEITTNPITANAIGASDIEKYMNPYQDQVIGALRRASNENLFTDILPNLQDRFVSAGQSRSPQEMQATNNAVYKSQSALDNAIAGSLQSGYTGALNTAAQQQGFLTNLAQQQQSQDLALRQQQQGFRTGVEQQQQGFQTGLAERQQAQNLGLQQQQQALRTALAQQQQAQDLALRQQQQSLGLNVAQGNRAAAQTAGAQAGQLGALTQQLGAADAGQLAASGQAQDTVNQAHVNAALNNFYAQQQWPYQNLGFASNIIRGLPVNTNQQTVGQTYNAQYSPSPLSQFVGTTLGASALGLKDGGRVRRPTGALSEWRRVA